MERRELQDFLLEQALEIDPMIKRKSEIEQIFMNGIMTNELNDEYTYLINEIKARIDFFNEMINGPFEV